MNINVGELNKKIQIIENVVTTDKDGYETNGEVVRHSCFAKFSRTSGTELTKANADFENIKVRFLIRSTKKKLSRKMFIRYAGDDYEIKYINDYEDDHQYTEIWAELIDLKG